MLQSRTVSSLRYRDAAISDALGQPLQQLRKAVEAVIPLAEQVHLRAGAGVQQLLEGGHVIGKRQQQRLIASAMSEDLPDMRVDGLGELGLLHGQRHMSLPPTDEVMIN